mmetsp:Transcript_44809/g.124186  ORF Transcript_44809/g.124186 Transcript_44809/m.124186 type:complete len:253 (+) Transcript_44809:1633-2391(+)
MRFSSLAKLSKGGVAKNAAASSISREAFVPPLEAAQMLASASASLRRILMKTLAALADAADGDRGIKALVASTTSAAFNSSLPPTFATEAAPGCSATGNANAPTLRNKAKRGQPLKSTSESRMNGKNKVMLVNMFPMGSIALQRRSAASAPGPPPDLAQTVAQCNSDAAQKPTGQPWNSSKQKFPPAPHSQPQNVCSLDASATSSQGQLSKGSMSQVVICNAKRVQFRRPPVIGLRVRCASHCAGDTRFPDS